MSAPRFSRTKRRRGLSSLITTPYLFGYTVRRITAPRRDLGTGAFDVRGACAFTNSQSLRDITPKGLFPPSLRYFFIFARLYLRGHLQCTVVAFMPNRRL